jgi:hypothetical protein
LQYYFSVLFASQLWWWWWRQPTLEFSFGSDIEDYHLDAIFCSASIQDKCWAAGAGDLLE